MFWKKLEFWLVAYLLVLGIAAALMIALNFPSEERDKVVFPYVDAQDNPRLVPFGTLGSPDQGLVFISLFAGIAGSFIPSAQSLSSYVGNQRFTASWGMWYFLRPWVGAILGLAIYVVFRAGLVSGTSAVNPYGVVALGLLGGWFSRTTTDKLREVFDTLFKTDENKTRRDKLGGEQPNGDDAESPETPENTTD